MIIVYVLVYFKGCLKFWGANVNVTHEAKLIQIQI